MNSMGKKPNVLITAIVLITMTLAVAGVCGALYYHVTHQEETKVSKGHIVISESRQNGEIQ